MSSRRRGKKVKTVIPVGHMAAIILNIILLGVLHRVPSWNLSFVTPRFADTLWAADLAIFGNLLANAVLMFYRRPWLRRLIQLVLNALALLWMYILLTVFPFQVPSGVEVALKVALALAQPVLVFLLIIDFVRLLVRQY